MMRVKFTGLPSDSPGMIVIWPATQGRDRRIEWAFDGEECVTLELEDESAYYYMVDAVEYMRTLPALLMAGQTVVRISMARNLLLDGG